jgi:TonB family protein
MLFKPCRNGAIAALILSLGLIPCGAWADLYSAQVAYNKQEFESAFNQYRELAELGQPKAQLNLAIMYLNGQGAPYNRIFAHAWASLAGANGETRGKEIAAQIEPDLTPESLQISNDIQAQFSTANLSARLMPLFRRDKEYADLEPVQRLKPFMPPYPREAQYRGVQGEVYVEFVVARDGRARLPRILHAIPEGYFESAVIDSVLRTTFLPARQNGIPVPTETSTFYNFELTGLKIEDYGDLAARVKKTLEKAEAGDTAAQLLYGMMLAGLPQIHGTYNQALPWFVKAAQAGAPYAQYQVGTGLLSGRGCQCDEGKGEIWLQKAAQADEPDAQVTLAEHLLRGKQNNESVAGALVWLERAARTGNSSAKLYLAALLAASPAPEVRNPKRAVELADAIAKVFGSYPSLSEIRAAAAAALGDYKTAGKYETQAVEQATKLSWDVSPLIARKTLYESQRPWTGDLLAF